MVSLRKDRWEKSFQTLSQVFISSFLKITISFFFYLKLIFFFKAPSITFLGVGKIYNSGLF